MTPGKRNLVLVRESEASSVVCECFPGRSFRRLSKGISRRILRKKKYFDAQSGRETEEFSLNSQKMPDDWDQNSLFYFDAQQEPLEDDEYPVVFTDCLPSKPQVLMHQPETMLSPESWINFAFDVYSSAYQLPDLTKQKAAPKGDSSHHAAYQSQTMYWHDSKPITYHNRDLSMRFLSIVGRSEDENEEDLREPRVQSGMQGFPGELTMTELAECHKFLRGLKAFPAIAEQVYSFRDIEEEPYTICRWLRATKFNADKILERLQDNHALFVEARRHNFYPDVSETIGAPFPVFLSQYPYLPIGKAKNGCPVNYFLAGQIEPEGILSMTTVDRVQGYFWWSFMHKYKSEIRAVQDSDPDFVRIEGIMVMDLQGLSSSALSAETMEVIKIASKISDYFPETLHCMLILNAPGFFSIFWGLIKKFIDPRTASRIQVFSSPFKGIAALHQLVSLEQIPVDYGGTNKSIKQAFVEEAADSRLLKQETSLLHIKKRKGRAKSKEEWAIGKDQYINIEVFTRSISSAEITIFLNGERHSTVSVSCGWNTEQESSARGQVPLPKCTVVVRGMKGPGKVRFEASDLDDDRKKHSALSRGYFLVVGSLISD